MNEHTCIVIFIIAKWAELYCMLCGSSNKNNKNSISKLKLTQKKEKHKKLNKNKTKTNKIHFSFYSFFTFASSPARLPLMYAASSIASQAPMLRRARFRSAGRPLGWLVGRQSLLRLIHIIFDAIACRLVRCCCCC
ncbi:unnamed protein product [Ceratitis capitata]|uniref:(Mediterranean fruit fly) hypothetical protein n=1 Tax=Ceratitis capitata TaxID=7213 RepID=A0A811V9M8_CERCA|nr:unnamed protein product [Ceratitis capitata]